MPIVNTFSGVSSKGTLLGLNSVICKVLNLFSYTDDGVLYYALFVGTPGEYGAGETPFTEDDFVTTTNSDVDSDPVNTSAFQFREKGPGNTGTPGEAGDIYWGDYYDTVASRMYYYPVARYTGTGDPNNPANHNWNSREYLN